MSALIAGVAVTLAACGAVSGGNLGTAGLAANKIAATGNGAAGTTGPAAGSPAAASDVPTPGTTIPTVGGSVPVAGAAVPAPSGNEPTVSYTATPIGSVQKLAGGMSLWPPANGSLPMPPGGPTATEPPSALPPAAQALSCPLTGPVSETIPAGFAAVAVVRCVPAIPASDQSAQLDMEVATSNLGPLLTALSAPAATGIESNPGPICLPAVADDTQLALIGANGQVVDLPIPVNGCGIPLPAVMTSLGALDWTVVS